MPASRAAAMSILTGPPRETATSFSPGSEDSMPRDRGANCVTRISASPMNSMISSALPRYSFRPSMPSTA
ncbi:hypothetical protein D3C78_1912730 [compost metagenome]